MLIKFIPNYITNQSNTLFNNQSFKMFKMGSSEKISIFPPQKGLEFPWGGGFCKAKKFKEMYSMKLNWNFQRDGGS